MRDRILIGLLMIIAALLVLSFVSGPRYAQSTGSGGAIACSKGGQLVYMVDSGMIYRSTDFGKRGSWAQVFP